jgi:calcium-translocating P-type ATPase
LDWYNKSANDVLQEQNVDKNKGLTVAQVQERQAEGLNKFAEKKREKLIITILKHLKDISIIILLIAFVMSTILSITTGKTWVAAVAIISIVIINIVLAVKQEKSVEKALDALAKLNSPSCIVLRDGVKMEVDTTEVVPGDVVILKTGDLVPADARIIECESFTVDESSLTGESVPSEKHANLLEKENAPLGDQHNMVFSGSLVATGHAKAIIVATGMNTQIGKIAKYLNETKKHKTPLQIRLTKLGRLISAVAVFSALLVLTIGLIRGAGQPAADYLPDLMLLTVALAVAAVPETLVVIVTLILIQGVNNMLKKNALVRKLQAVETLGSTSVICSDKTGTLTQNRMAIKRLWLYGSDPVSDENTTDDHIWFLKKLLLASNVSLEVENGNETIIGDPTESSIMRLFMAKELCRNELNSLYERVLEIPFSSARKMMTVVVKQPSGKYLVLTKGAFDKIPFVRKNEGFMQELNAVHNAFADDALRLITLASKEIDFLPTKDDVDLIEKELTFEGFIGIIDPPRPEAALSIALAKKAGVRTVMITGDHAATATAIARELGIIEGKEGVITGEQLSKLSDDELFDKVKDYSVYARVSPEDKIRIVQAWQKKGDVVAMTGDGVNDAPALKGADVGVAMGINGTEVAKSASDIVLTDDNFTTIVGAVSEGRNVFANIKKLVYFLLVCNLTEIVVILFGYVVWNTMLVTPVMLLIVNLLCDGIPGMGLAKERSDPRIMDRGPIKRKESFFAGGLFNVMVQQILVWSVVTALAFYIGRNINLGFVPGDGSDAAWLTLGQTMCFLVLGWTSVLHVLNVRSRRSVFTKSLKENKQLTFSVLGMLLALPLMVLIPGVNTYLGFIHMGVYHWLIAIGLGVVPIIVAEIVKIFDNYRFNKKNKKKIIEFA